MIVPCSYVQLYVYYYRTRPVHQLRSRNSSFSSRTSNSVINSRHFCSPFDISVRFARYHQLIEKQEYRDAASDLMAIFVEEVAPTSWWVVALCDSVQLLSYSKFKIGVTDRLP